MSHSESDDNSIELVTPPDDRAPSEELVPLPPEHIDQSCSSGARQGKVITVNFPKPEKTCEWGVGGNLVKRNQYFQARIEQRVDLNLPANSIICDAKMSFREQDFLYDDHFLLLFNKSVIAASYDFSSRLDTQVYGSLEYDWDKLKGMPWDASKEMIFCPQVPGGEAMCSFPGHDKSGTVDLQYNPGYVKTIMSNGIPSQHSFSLIYVGDNVSLSYVQATR